MSTSSEPMATAVESPFAEAVAAFVREEFVPHHGDRRDTFPTHPLWGKLNALRTELWLDTGDAEAVSALWTQEFSALTTNNTLLNREVQKGAYDGFIRDANALLNDQPGLDEETRRLEVAFMLNARHALTLVEQFDAYVSVEEHTDLAGDVSRAVNYARRFHAICPERFIVKIPFSAAGLLATRRVSALGIPVNHTLGFSARQNHLAARIGRPAFVNVFLGRLNSFVANNGLGTGDGVGERATLASQAAVRACRDGTGLTTRQIAASLRDGPQVRALAGVDVMTMPPSVASEFLELDLRAEHLEDRTRGLIEVGVSGEGRALGVDALWEVDDRLTTCVDVLEREDLDRFSPDDLHAFFADHRCADILPKWAPAHVRTSRSEGKVPKAANWRDQLTRGIFGLDSIMNLAGLNQFAADQEAMDQHVRDVLA